MVSCISLLTVVALAAVASAIPSGRQCFCPYIYAPVCASNGKVYPNACTVKCDKNAGLKVVHDGRCGKLFQVANENEIEAVSADFCPCTMEYEPICGSDHHTYPNKCMLKCAAKKNQSLKMLHDGGCDLPFVNFKLNWPNVPEIPEIDDIPDFNLTVEDESASCVCTREYAPVCGSNFHTYSNMCMLECAMKKDKSLKMLYPSICVEMP